MTTLLIDELGDRAAGATLTRVPSVLRPPIEPARFVQRWGQSSVSPFVVGADKELILMGHRGVAGFVRRGRWAVMATDPVAVPGLEDEVLDAALTALADRRLRPVIVAAVEPEPYRRRGLHAVPIAEDPLLDLCAFDLAGRRRASVRHSVTSARRAGLRVVPLSRENASGAEAVSRRWLCRKRGGELGFTLGRFDSSPSAGVECRVALDRDQRVVGFVTWHCYDNGRARVLDLMRRDPEAPNPTMDLLVAESLLEFAAAGVAVASLGCVPCSHGPLAERVYPTVSLRRFKDKFAPFWEPRHLITPSRLALAGGLVATGRAYSPDGLVAALRRNG